jgi:hypothetical protein
MCHIIPRELCLGILYVHTVRVFNVDDVVGQFTTDTVYMTNMRHAGQTKGDHKFLKPKLIDKKLRKFMSCFLM